MMHFSKIHAHQYGGEDEEQVENFHSTHTCAFFPSIPQLPLNNLDYMALYRQSTNGWIR
jgi:hypothetical protein